MDDLNDIRQNTAGEPEQTSEPIGTAPAPEQAAEPVVTPAEPVEAVPEQADEPVEDAPEQNMHQEPQSLSSTSQSCDPAYGAYNSYGSDSQSGSGTPGLSIASLVCGILSILVGCCCVGPLFSIPAIITGIMSRKKPGNESDGMALAGIITGIVGIALSLIMFAIGFIAGIAEASNGF